MPKPQKKEPAPIQTALASNVGTLEPGPISDEMRRAYIDYAMSVIVARALPDVRDGFKPVHRRILYSMWKNGLRSTAKFKKCASVVGDVLAKYHPHGDMAVYDSLVRMAQDFSLRYPLIKGQGNFGSLDGDGAAAYRYTESKLQAIAEEMLFDIDKETVPFAPNFDGSEKEPTVLPAKLPNLLLNGTLGIAVGMATNIPPHNLTEVCDAVVALIENPDVEVEDLMKFIKGPDFPTGGIIYDKKEILNAYATGKAGIVMRAKTEITEDKAGAYRILVTEIPYQVNKAQLLEKIAELVQDKKIEGIRDLRDESAKGDVRIVVELKKDAYPKKVLNQLFKMTPLQETFHVNMLALVDGVVPRVLPLKTMLEEYVKHRQTVVRKRTEYDLAKAKERAHILEGLRIALLKINEVIETIKKSKDKDEAKVNLMKKFKLSDAQSQAILEMRLQALANLERLKVEQEYKEKMELIAELESILKSVKKMLDIIRKEVLEIKDKYGDARRTQVVAGAVGEFSMEDLVPDEPTVVMLTTDGYIKRLPPDTFRTQKRGGKGVMGLSTKDEDQVEQLFSTSTHADLMFFTTRGRVFQLKAYDVPQGSRTAKGQAIVNFLQLAPGERVATSLAMDDIEGEKFLVMVTNQGTIKKTSLDEFENVRRSGLIAIRLHEGDDLRWVKPTSGSDEISLVTKNGQSIRFKEADVRGMGRVAAGVRGIKLKKADEVIGMDVINPAVAKKGQLELFTLAENGLGKRTNLTEYKVQGRGGSGIRTMRVTAKTGGVVAAYVSGKDDDRDLMIISKNGIVIRTPFSSVSSLGRDTQGVRVMRFKEEGDKVSSCAFLTGVEKE
ncbi:DNA gyrase subunit A [Candidatus Uhrbacteria bacterium RIFCSPHIGHO2_12_FULL_60_25]|uniref:DNA gyrase subunit A n=1 Tax=Candidatus Uhrbacteria bacterium RIFCSPHIGHO2_12_FULL_60_25 TaxID=1802399 RepID=A0A1F7UNC5_9BACT|nr:MAG: DNA gyrase subunit A [Candidatus Uhrbacteria bacterium RIFCSPHIGHO2_02_FULL_60_44]OGL79759.1 MAG: DNA gyrase subunit A [Candidatus Uhrbacteria bacterium RIFCSPHIGHO2_12_FULL_60_25]